MGNPEVKLYEYLIGTLSEKEAGEIKSWIEASDKNQMIFDQIKSVYDNSEINEGQFKPNVDIAWNAVDLATSNTPKQKQVFFSTFYRVAAAIVVMVGLAYVAMQGDLFVDYQTIATGEDEQREVQLADGTVVTLNENSQLRFPKEFSSDERKVKLVGQAFFEVARDEMKPFQIVGPQTSVQVLGTSFDLISRVDYSNINVVTGKVAFTSNNNDEQQLILIMGQQASMSGKTMVNEGRLDSNALAWRTGELTFNSTPIAEVVETLNQHFEVSITYDEQISECLITSTFKDKKLKEILEILYTISKIENSQDGDNIKLSGPGC